MPSFVHDPRHAYSYELRPTSDLDLRLRAIADELEQAGMIAAGATTAPRFHPHITLLRAAVPSLPAATAAAGELVASAAAVRFDSAGSFGDGRIAYITPADRQPLDAARGQLLDRIDEAELDPLARVRDIHHVTLAYAVPEDSRFAVRRYIEAALPIEGFWGSLEVWDLDVRPTVLVHRIMLG